MVNCSWCRTCRLWVDYYHFVRWVEKGYFRAEVFDGCGQSNANSHIRYHPEHPLCGDVWQVEKDLFFVVDYNDSFSTGLTYSDGKQRGFSYTSGYAEYLRSNRAILISTKEEKILPFSCDERGWTSNPNCPNYSKEKSMEFLNERIQECCKNAS